MALVFAVMLLYDIFKLVLSLPISTPGTDKSDGWVHNTSVSLPNMLFFFLTAAIPIEIILRKLCV